MKYKNNDNAIVFITLPKEEWEGLQKKQDEILKLLKSKNDIQYSQPEWISGKEIGRSNA